MNLTLRHYLAVRADGGEQEVAPNFWMLCKQSPQYAADHGVVGLSYYEPIAEIVPAKEKALHCILSLHDGREIEVDSETFEKVGASPAIMRGAGIACLKIRNAAAPQRERKTG